MSENLTPRQRKAVEALLTCCDTSQAAEAAGVSRETVYRWMREPAFREALQEATREALEGLSRELVRLGVKAVQALVEVLDGPEAAAARVRAADVILGRLLQARELIDMETRLAELERKAKHETTQRTN